MEFVKVVHDAILSSGRRAYVYLTLASLGTFAISVLVNSVTDYDPAHGPDYELLVAFILVCAVTVVSRGETTRIMNAVGEGLAHHMRQQYARLLRRADFAEVERIGKDTIYTTLARNAQVLAESPAVLAQGVASVGAFILATLYIAYLSLLAAAAIAVLIFVVYLASQFRKEHTQDDLAAGQKAEQEFFDTFSHYLHGLKEARMDPDRGDDLFENFLTARANRARELRLKALDSMIAFGVVVFGSFYLLLGTVTFITPQYVETASIAMKIVYTSSVMWLLIESLLRIMPTVARGNAAFTELRKLEVKLRAVQRPDPQTQLPLPKLRSLELRGIAYTYPPQEEDGQPFAIGPCDLLLKPGEATFLVGGNGSGKTTLLRNLCLLYKPQAGAVLWNGVPVTDETAADYRRRISAVFADFHLFDRIYGNRDIDPARVTAMLERVQLNAKTRYVNGRFTTLDLSTGQRKRLALALALLENRDIYLFDEIAADQDPNFRRRIYEEFIPELKARGKAVLAITHDERYFGTADAIYFMDEGQLSRRSV
jgi:putative ATP-binding cassette transporter